MVTWLHDLDALRSLASEAGLLGSWARLQCLTRGAPAGLPGDWLTIGPALALRPEGLDAWMPTIDAQTVGPLRKATLHLGIGPSDAATWVGPLEALLTGPSAGDAACVLLAIGRLRRDHLPALVRSAAGDPALPAWILAVTPPAERDAVAGQLAESLREDLAHGATSTLTTLLHLHGGLLASAPEDPVDAAGRGVALAAGRLDGPPDVSVPKGSHRARSAGLVEAYAAGRTDPVASFVRALARLRKGPPVPTPALMLLAWQARFIPSGDPLDDARRGARGIPAVAAARQAVAAGGPVPTKVLTPTDAALLAEALRLPDPLPAARGLRDADPFDEGTDLARFAAAAVCPTIVADLLDDAHRRDEGFALAPLAPTEAVLERLLGASVPAHPSDRRSFAWGLARMGTPATLPTLRALIGHLEPAVVSEVREQVAAILGVEL